MDGLGFSPKFMYAIDQNLMVTQMYPNSWSVKREKRKKQINNPQTLEYPIVREIQVKMDSSYIS